MQSSTWSCVTDANTYSASLGEEMTQLKLEHAQLQIDSSRDRQTVSSLEQRLADVEMDMIACLKGSKRQAKGKKRSKSTCTADVAEHVDDEECVVYEVRRSMWDVVLLLPFGKVGLSQRIVIVIGIALTLGLQLLMALVIRQELLDTKIDTAKVQQMVSWRVEMGHHHEKVDNHNGLTVLQQLCSQSLWSFEQQQYSGMYGYAYRNIPGYCLSLAATVLWSMRTMLELRLTFNQASAIWCLPRLSWGTMDTHGLCEDGGEFHIEGITSSMRFLCFLICVLPRGVVLALLTLIGCQCLAQTVSLTGIILNTVALVFIIGMDKLLGDMLLSGKTRCFISDLHPIRSGRSWKCFGCFPSNVFCCILGAALILFTYIFYLEPFHQNVSAAATALCGGELDFTWTGGNDSHPLVVLLDTNDWVPSCDPRSSDDYFSRYYSGANMSSQTYNQVDKIDWADQRKVAVLNNSFVACPEDQVLDPTGECRAIPSILAEALPKGVTAGSKLEEEACRRFDAELGAAACIPHHLQACHWTWLSQACDGPAPGKVYLDACGDNLALSCSVWEGIFRKRHPTRNCEMTYQCGEGSHCLVAVGQLTLNVSNKAVFEAQQNVTEAAIADGLATALNVSRKTVDILQVRGWPFNWPSNKSNYTAGRQSSTRPHHFRDMPLPEVYLSSGPVVIGGVALVRFVVETLPDTLLPDSVPGHSTQVASAINALLVKATGVTESVVAAAEFVAWPGHYYREDSLMHSMTILRSSMANATDFGNSSPEAA